MLVCPGCSGRNPPQLEVCPFCHRRLGARASLSRRLRALRLMRMLLGAVLVIVLVVGAGLLVLARAASAG